MNKSTYLKIIVGIAAVILLVVGGIALWRSIAHTEVGVEVDDRIHVTPEQIASIKAIGEWEFLSVADEEMVDTVRKGFFSDDHLVRIYYGTLRLGINMHDVQPGWLKAEGDSVVVTLPDIRLLDNDFIDEARTKSFYEKGEWSGKDREALYQRAHRMMVKRGMTKQNIESARENGKEQFRSMMRAMGYPKTHITFKK